MVKIEYSPYALGSTALVIIGVVIKPMNIEMNVPPPIIIKFFKKLFFKIPSPLF